MTFKKALKVILTWPLRKVCLSMAGMWRDEVVEVGKEIDRCIAAANYTPTNVIDAELKYNRDMLSEYARKSQHWIARDNVISRWVHK